MMQIYSPKKLYRILSFVCAVMILFLSPCARYIDASSIPVVHAVEEGIAGGAIAADAVIKFLIATFGTVAAKEAYEKYKEEVDQSFYDYMSAPSRWGDLIGESASSTCVKIYNKSKNTIESISWEDMMTSLSTGHDAVVDNLTDIYAQYCPALLQCFDDFITDVLSGDVYIQGFSDTLDMVDTFSDYESIQNTDGTYHIAGYYEWTALSGGTVGTLHNYSYVYSGDPVYRPVGFVSSPNTVTLRVYNDITRSLDSFAIIGFYYIDGVYQRYYSVTSFNPNASVNIPIFANMEAAKAAFETGTFSDALNYCATTMESVIDLTKVPDLAPDIPPFTRAWQQKQWGEAADVIDFGGIAAGEYEGDDLPFWGLAELDEFAQTLQDVFDKTLEGIFEGTDVIEFPTTYDDVWDDAFSDAWDRVKDGALDIPVDDTGEAELDKVRPYPWEGNPAIPDDPAIPDNPAVDIPADSVVDIPIEDIVPTVSDSFLDIAGSLRYKFPFSIPWDIHYMLSGLAETPKAPRFELPIVIERYRIEEKIIIDMEMFQTLSDLSRSFFSMLFAIFLVNLTFKVVGMRKEE